MPFPYRTESNETDNAGAGSIAGFACHAFSFHVLQRNLQPASLGMASELDQVHQGLEHWPNGMDQHPPRPQAFESQYADRLCVSESSDFHDDFMEIKGFRNVMSDVPRPATDG